MRQACKKVNSTRSCCLREIGTPRCEELFAESIELMKQPRALMDANKPPEPPPKNPLAMSNIVIAAKITT
eukprot:5858544-Pleurochrysis_carterae.AAC.1